ncbi:metalloregulator ArsR/SmtB family transcription factor [Tsuneonella sp. YG55]|uniref:Metalloregulator ArsR/SmtB family transcription factor n=1 Tax=Tsuneonella litorea TaxID=2976475 RepID=A0A9X2W2Y2_9SPHN|nr:metalloregulator ArsR/SmtB family transcription factor [Tsuneonella litorea]MCT2559619.1 metalloregulator ArsR/SmtB family transcription factor [Tsuneonella litorea]
MTIETVMRALGDPTRLRIMRLIGTMELAVGELAHVLGQSQPRVSRHVAILADAGLAERRREGSWVFLRQSHAAGKATVAAVARLLAAAEDEDEQFARTCEEDRRHLAAIRDAREANAAEFFARHAGEWDRLRALLAPAEAVEAALVDALGVDALGEVLDIGTGTGRIAELLEPDAAKVTGVDKSPEMLRLARARLQNLPAGRVELVQGDFAALPFEADRFDTVVFHQVLHYAQQPDYALAEAARVCRAGGRIVIADLAAHDREELRRTHAHARLGFADEQMEAMLARHGFACGPVATVEGGELAVKVWAARRLPPSVSRIGGARELPAAARRKAAAR